MELSEATQKRLGVLADWDIYILEPLKRIHIDDIHNDLSTNGEKSDFYGLQDQIKVILCIVLEGRKTLLKTHFFLLL